VERISLASKQMDALIRDLLAFSRLARDKVDISAIDTGPLLTKVVAGMRLEGNPVCLQGVLPAVMGNRVLLSQVFSNLIGNGVKFVVRGVEPRIVIRSEEGQDGWVRTWIEDNGIGIAAEYHEKIFQVFERLNESSAYPGTGIGLAIVRRAMSRMGGRVGVESEEGKGSRFWVELPRAGAGVQPLSPGEVPKAGSAT
jgi:signal transduction histidine kinase